MVYMCCYSCHYVWMLYITINAKTIILYQVILKRITFHYKLHGLFLFTMFMYLYVDL